MDCADHEAQAQARYEAQLAQQRRDCLLAGTLSVEAAAGLLRFQDEGPVCNFPFGDEEIVAKLAEATLLAARVEGDHMAEQPAYADYREGLGQLAAACAKFLSDQANRDLLDVGDPGEILESEVPY